MQNNLRTNRLKSSEHPGENRAFCKVQKDGGSEIRPKKDADNWMQGSTRRLRK